MEKRLIKKILVNTKDLIHSDSFLKKHRLNNGFTRQGKLSFTDIMYFILSRENKSISINISNMRRFFSTIKDSTSLQTGDLESKTKSVF